MAVLVHIIVLFVVCCCCYFKTVKCVLCPVLYVDAPAAPFLRWRLLTSTVFPLSPSSSSSSFDINQCSSIAVFMPTRDNVCMDENLATKNRKRWQPKDRTLDVHYNKPAKWHYPNPPHLLSTTLDVHDIEDSKEAWKIVQNNISKYRLYDPDSKAVADLVENMKKLPIVKIENEDTDLGTWFKLFMTLSDGTEVLFKPMHRDRQHARTGDDIYYFADFERHNAEIAAYHVDRVLGFNWVPPTVGRLINITAEIEPLAGPTLKETIYTSPIGNKCIHGTCDECKMYNAICGSPDVIEGSLQFVVPHRKEIIENSIESPYARTYWKGRQPQWLNDPQYCHQVEVDHKDTRLLLDLMDIAIFDFITGNQDRHHLQFFPKFDKLSFPILLDNGRAFGRPDQDDESTLTPIMHCCLVRYSTLKRLLDLQKGPKKLSQAFVESSRSDLVYPLVTDDFLTALDRRVDIVIRKIEACVHANKFQQVVIDDFF